MRVKKNQTVFQVAFAHLKLIRTAFTIKQYRSSAEPNMFLNLTVNYISKDNQDIFYGGQALNETLWGLSRAALTLVH